MKNSQNLRQLKNSNLDSSRSFTKPTKLQKDIQQIERTRKRYSDPQPIDRPLSFFPEETEEPGETVGLRISGSSLGAMYWEDE